MAAEAAQGGSARYFPGGERLAFFLLLVGILIAAYFTIRPVLLVLLLAAGTASLTAAPYRRMARAFGKRRRLAAGVASLAVLLLVLGPLAALVVFGARRLAAEIAQLPALLASAQRAADQLSRRLGPSLGRSLQLHQGQAQSTVPEIAKSAGAWAGTIGGAVIHFGAAVFLFGIALYYFYVDGVAFRERLVRLLPIPPRYARAFLARFREVSLSVLVGNLGIAAFHAVLSGIAFWIFGVPAPLLLAIVTGVLSFVPTIGVAIVWVPTMVYLGIADGWLRALLFLGYGVFVIGVSDNFLRPILIKRGLRMHTLLVFVAVLGGLATFGVAGLFVGPLVIALAVAALDLYEREPPSEYEV